MHAGPHQRPSPKCMACSVQEHALHLLTSVKVGDEVMTKF